MTELSPSPASASTCDSGPTGQMHFLVATHSHLLAVRVDSGWNLRDASVLSKGYHYGIGVDERTGGAFVYRGGEDVFDSSAPALLTIAPSWPPVVSGRTALADRIRDVHQITSANGGLYVANTRYNQVLYCDFRGRTIHEHQVGGLDADVNHVNSIYVCGDRLLVMLHNAHRRESEILVLEHDETGMREVVRLSLWDEQCHNLFLDRQGMWYNGSTSRSVVLVDPYEGRVRTRWRFDHHTKGFAVVDDFIITGLSDYADREKRGQSEGALVVLDRATLAQVAQIPLRATEIGSRIGNINEIRALRPVDLGQRGAGLRGGWENLKLARQQRLRLCARRARISGMRVPRAIRARFWARGGTV